MCGLRTAEQRERSHACREDLSQVCGPFSFGSGWVAGPCVGAVVAGRPGVCGTGSTFAGTEVAQAIPFGWVILYGSLSFNTRFTI